MAREIIYGLGSRLSVDLPGDAVIQDCAVAPGTPLDDPVAAAAAAVCDPLDFPPLERATVPGDHITLAVEPGVPRAAEVVAGIVQTLLDGPTRLADIRILVADQRGRQVTSLLPSAVAAAIEVFVHDPRDSSAHGYLAASREARPIYFHRQLCEADIVIPIGTLRVDQSFGYLGVHGCLYPTFSDEETIQRFRAPSSHAWEVHRRRRLDEVEEAAWLLGVQFTVQVAPGPGNSVMQVLAGDAHTVARKGQELCESTWKHAAPKRASLVVAAIEGGPEQQTWDNFARALFNASRAVTDGGCILLCTDLTCRPGPALERLTTAAEGAETILHEIRRVRSSDAVSASMLAETRNRARIYLISGLSSDFVEDLGMGHVSTLEEAQRLSRQYGSCILLGNAQHTVLDAVHE